jgi:hypothetical protein
MKQKTLCAIIIFTISFILFLSEIAFAGVPIPWGAKLIMDDVAVTGSGEERKITSYETKAGKQELLNYYLKEMPIRGYKLFMNGEQNLVFSKADELVLVVVRGTSAGGKTNFIISTASMGSLVNKTNSYGSSAECESIPSVPVYPGARCMNSTRLKSGGSRSATYTTEESISVVIDFYRGQMQRYGWQIENENNFGDMLKAMQEKQQGAMTLEQQAVMRDFLGNSRGMNFSNQAGNRCFVQVMNNPMNKEVSLISIVYEDKASKQ